MTAASYRTWLVGKYGLQGGKNEKRGGFTPADWPAYPTRRGFDDFYGSIRHGDGHQHYPPPTTGCRRSPRTTTVRLEAGPRPVQVMALADADVSLEPDFQLQ